MGTMSDFSEMLKEEIKKSKQTLLYLSDISGFSVDHISKMRLGKRLPQDAEKVTKLIRALQCSEKTEKELFLKYNMERVGKEEWSCMQTIRKMLEFNISFLDIPQGQRASFEKEIQSIEVLRTRTEVFSFMSNLLYSKKRGSEEGKSIFMWTEDFPETMVEILAQYLNQSKCTCEHIFSLRPPATLESSLHNLECIYRILPLIYSGSSYIAYYDYGKMGEELVANWIIGEEYAVGLNHNMEGGIVIWNTDTIRYLREQFRKKKKHMLLKYYQDAFECVDEECNVCDNEPEKRSSKNYRVKYEPCFLLFLPDELIEEHILLEGEQKQKLMELIRKMKNQIHKENMVDFFMEEGIESAIREGRIKELPDEAYAPFTTEECIEGLRAYFSWMKDSENEFYVINSKKLDVSPYAVLYISEEKADFEVRFCTVAANNISYSIQEPGIAERIKQFCKGMESGEFVFSREQSEKILKGFIDK